MSGWGAQPPLPTDTDPQVPDDWLQPDVDEQVEAAFDEGWSSGFGAGVGIRPWLVIGFAIANLLIGFWFAVNVAHAAPRSAPDPVMSFEDVLPAVQGPSGAPLAASVAHPDVALGAPLPSPTSDPGPAPAAGAVGSPLQGVQGLATWYCCTRHHPSGLYAAAGPALRVGHWRGRVVEVCSAGGCVRARLIDWCLCGHGRVIDLYRQAFRRLAPLSVGIVGVTVSWGGEPPATDTKTP